MMSLACEYQPVNHQQSFEKLLRLFQEKDILAFSQITHKSQLSPFEIRELLFELEKMNKVVHDEVRDLYYLL